MSNTLEWILMSAVTCAYCAISCWYVYRYLDIKKPYYAIVNSIGMVVLMILLQLLSEENIFVKLENLTAVALCFPAAWIDAKKQLIPNKIVLTGLIIRVILYIVRAIVDMEGLLAALKSDGIALVLIIVFCLIGLLFVRDGIGMGDVKLLMVMSVLFGIRSMFGALFFTLVVGFFYSLYMLIIKKYGKKSAIPFAPCILIGTYISVILYII